MLLDDAVWWQVLDRFGVAGAMLLFVGVVTWRFALPNAQRLIDAHVTLLASLERHLPDMDRRQDSLVAVMRGLAEGAERHALQTEEHAKHTERLCIRMKGVQNLVVAAIARKPPPPSPNGPGPASLDPEDTSHD